MKKLLLLTFLSFSSLSAFVFEDIRFNNSMEDVVHLFQMKARPIAISPITSYDKFFKGSRIKNYKNQNILYSVSYSFEDPHLMNLLFTSKLKKLYEIELTFYNKNNKELVSSISDSLKQYQQIPIIDFLFIISNDKKQLIKDFKDGVYSGHLSWRIDNHTYIYFEPKTDNNYKLRYIDTKLFNNN